MILLFWILLASQFVGVACFDTRSVQVGLCLVYVNRMECLYFFGFLQAGCATILAMPYHLCHDIHIIPMFSWPFTCGCTSVSTTTGLLL